MRISQSFLKDYHSGKCGLVLKAKYQDFNFPEEESNSMNAGKFFEYMATGYIRHGEEPPHPEYYQKSGNGYNAGDMKPDFQLAVRHAELFKKTMQEHKIEIVSTGQTIAHLEMQGITDVIGAIGDDNCIIDLKYSGLLYDRWNEYGWGIEKFEYFKKVYEEQDLLMALKAVPLMWQPLHYCYIYSNQFGNYPRWFFYIASSKDEDVIFRELIISKDIHKTYAVLIESIKAELSIIIETGGFDVNNSYNNCNTCPLECEQRINVPQIESFVL